MTDDTFMTRSQTGFAKPRKIVSRNQKNSAIVARSSLGTRKYHFITRDPNRFGSLSPTWTIPSSRQDPRPVVPTPGPGAYEVPPSDHRLAPSFTIKERPSIDYTTVTSNIEYVNKREFPDIRKTTIGTKHPIRYGDPNIKAEPVAIPNFDGKWKSYKISERYLPPPPDQIPSPSRYNPNDPSLPTPISYSLPHSEERDVNAVPKEMLDIPGPGSYDVVKPVINYTGWAQRLIPKNKRYKPPEKANAEKPWIVKKEETGEKNYIEFETLEPPEATNKEDVSK
ncbi:hypothetical protein TRFO_18065 [Tritrichomonas foetus]|uniref:Uncharacterized protein n=1 Tax=Tritrichomonas foetus TaxID=1144522 RepID=A0A1J4KLR7_9EUKA|nr:hypothetical protein TRFO_18065 [Tritrichomonas foetus]|eukprot:OHT12255.1 hypothetical protein TRFO_18065 [Tritrichomonas foetus]